MALTSERFPEFFRAIYAHEPYPWQVNLARRVTDAYPKDNPWPAILALPTGTGKTACIDIAVFALACQATRSPLERTAPRRIFFIIDRRVVVDQAYERARSLAEKLRDATSGVLWDVAEALRQFAAGRTGATSVHPLTTVQLRGATYRDVRWVRTPTQPAIIATTVDQVGSRLLFRGYGISPRQQALHAALVANDSLMLLDEAHCSNAFSETLATLSRYRTAASHPLHLPPFHVSFLTATPGADVHREVFSLGKPDELDERLRRRLEPRKLVRLVVAPKAKGRRFHQPLADTLVAEARRFAADGAKAIAIVVNRVRTAQLVSEMLVELRDSHVLLMTGRMRPVDRTEIIAGIQRGFANDGGTWFLVATQCIEVGADYDFDAMVTECASLEALKQRFGRLNRAGRHDTAHGAVVVRADQQEVPHDDASLDPVYGSALPVTWIWLNQQAEAGVIDLSSRGFALLPAPPDSLYTRREHAPIMLPGHLDAWSQTQPAPIPSPDVAPFLHGPNRDEPDVYVCWRADLSIESDGTVPTTRWRDALSLCPPSIAECLPTPIRQFTAWLRSGQTAPDVADLEGLAGVRTGADEDKPDSGQLRAPVLRWRGDESEWVLSDQLIAAGDVLVVPASYGGWESLGVVPAPWDTVGTIDRAERAYRETRRRAVLRVHPALLERWPTSAAVETLRQMAFEATLDSLSSIDRGQLGNLLSTIGGEMELSSSLMAREISDAIDALGAWRLVSYPLGGFLLLGEAASASEVPELTDEDDLTSTSGRSDLIEHCNRVAEQVYAFGTSCGLPTAVVADLQLAAKAHDAGKADPRFQAWLHGGSRLLAAASGRLLARSPQISSTARARARRLSGYPDGARHEALSVRLAESSPDLMNLACDPDLVLHLIASHHGYCRPLAPVVRDDETATTSIELVGHVLAATSAADLHNLRGGVLDRFWRLIRRYGWWGLAWVEAQLRLADATVSEAEQRAMEQMEEPREEVAS